MTVMLTVGLRLRVGVGVTVMVRLRLRLRLRLGMRLGMQVHVRQRLLCCRMACCACGSSGVAVYPHSTTRLTPRHSAVRNIDPTLNEERRWSSTSVSGTCMQQISSKW